MKPLRSFFAFAASLAVCSAAHAALIVTNGSFETTTGSTVTSGEWFTLQPNTGWTGGTSPYAIYKTNNGGGFFLTPNVPQGINVLNLSAVSPISQNVGTVVAGEQITLDFAVGRESGSNGSYNGAITVDLLLNGDLTPFATQTFTLTAGDFPAAGRFVDRSLLATATGAGTVTLRFSNGGTDANSRVWLDNVAITSELPEVPEPASLGLLGVGALALLRRRR